MTARSFAMRSRDDAAELARICAVNARAANSEQVATELWRMATEYQAEATKLASGHVPDIGEPPRAAYDK
jgi:hypothetical protein